MKCGLEGCNETLIEHYSIAGDDPLYECPIHGFGKIDWLVLIVGVIIAVVCTYAFFYFL